MNQCCCIPPDSPDTSTPSGVPSELPRAVGVNIPLHSVLHEREEWYTEVTELPVASDGIALPYTRVWIVGSATSGGWWTPFRIEMLYDKDAPAGAFTWYGILQAGELKFPLGPDSWDVPMLMPKAVNADNLASLSETSMEVVAPGEVDKKWIVSEDEVGNYRITLNINTLQVEFTKME